MTDASLKGKIEDDPEIKRMLDTIADRVGSVFGTMARARRICKRDYQRSPNWVLAGDLFGLGSTYSFALCRMYGIDPDAKTVARSVSDRSPKGQDAQRLDRNDESASDAPTQSHNPNIKGEVE